ncbi:MAG: hypothetical protein KKC79_09705, partial [Gammaproteobacteria bacterium]|nr:hypothetical protein [Gammaproteobacteria bacterium]
MKSTHVMPFGATVLDNDQGVRFSLWAPGVEQLMLALGADDAARTLPMPRDIDGWHRLDEHEIGLGAPHERARVKVVPRDEMVR